MKTLDELKEQQARELADFETRQKLAEALRDVPGFDEKEYSISLYHGGYASARLWEHFQVKHKLVDAVAVVKHFKDSIIEGEHWKDGCVSTWPAEINSCIKNERAVMDGAHAVEIKVQGGRGYGPDVTIQFWTRVVGMLCEIICPVCDCWQLVPRIDGHYDRHGNWSGKVEWNPAETQTADKFRTFWSEKPSYRGSYYLADVPNFEAWASRHGERRTVAA